IQHTRIALMSSYSSRAFNRAAWPLVISRLLDRFCRLNRPKSRRMKTVREKRNERVPRGGIRSRRNPWKLVSDRFACEEKSERDKRDPLRIRSRVPQQTDNRNRKLLITVLCRTARCWLPDRCPVLPLVIRQLLDPGTVVAHYEDFAVRL